MGDDDQIKEGLIVVAGLFGLLLVALLSTVITQFPVVT